MALVELSGDGGDRRLPPRFLAVDGVLGGFGDNRTRARERYVEFVADGIEDALPERLVGEIYLGDEAFIRGLMPNELVAAVSRIQWQPLRPSLEQLCREPAGLLEAYRLYGYRLREIGAHLGVHAATVSRALARLEHAQAAQTSRLPADAEPQEQE